MEDKEIDKRFTRHQVNGDQLERMTFVTEMLRDIAKKLNKIVPDGREKSRMMSCLEDATMNANAGIARENFGK